MERCQFLSEAVNCGGKLSPGETGVVDRSDISKLYFMVIIKREEGNIFCSFMF